MMFLCNWNNDNAISMDIDYRSFGIPSPKGGEVSAVEEYVIRDVEATHNLFEKLKGYII